jgi:hypothetical protein
MVQKEGVMHSKILVGLLLVVGVLAAGTFASDGMNMSGDRQWSIVNITTPTRVEGQLLMGPYLIVHDDAKMARGEACTTFYRFDPKKGPQEEAVSFQCIPAQKEVPARTTLVTKRLPGCDDLALAEYQFAGDAEAHGVPRVTR